MGQGRKKIILCFLYTFGAFRVVIWLNLLGVINSCNLGLEFTKMSGFLKLVSNPLNADLCALQCNIMKWMIYSVNLKIWAIVFVIFQKEIKYLFLIRKVFKNF